jgi:hypothetical protein
MASSKFIKPFEWSNFGKADEFTYIGSGRLGAKALGLARVKERLEEFCSQHKDIPICIDIPRMTVLTTQVFDTFMEENSLYYVILSDLSDEDIALRFSEARLPASLIRDLEVLVNHYDTPLAVRSSSILEDSLISPFAGVYKTRMIPNNNPDPVVNLQQLKDAIKFVYASAFFKEAKLYLKSGCYDLRDERMAVIIQEVVGDRYHDRYYPNVSGSACSYNFYPTGHALPADGVVSLALGLGKSIVDGGAVWTYSPQYPEINPPYNSVKEMLKKTQLDFWAVDMSGKNDSEDGLITNTRHLRRLSLKDAETDKTLGIVASTYDYESDRVNIGIGFGGSRIVNFAPLLNVDLVPANQLIISMLEFCEHIFESKVEIHFAMNFDLNRTRDHLARFGLLQVRSLGLHDQMIAVDESEWNRDTVLAASGKVLGNGWVNCIKDILYVVPETFNLKDTEAIAAEIAAVNRQLVESESPYLLIGFGRWGTRDPWLGIPVDWNSICGARVIVESGFYGVNIQLSQGFHFFHNLCNLKILYFSIKKDEPFQVHWNWLKQQEAQYEGKYIRHVRLNSPLSIKVDGRKHKGAIYK